MFFLAIVLIVLAGVVAAWLVLRFVVLPRMVDSLAREGRAYAARHASCTSVDAAYGASTLTV